MPQTPPRDTGAQQARRVPRLLGNSPVQALIWSALTLLVLGPLIPIAYASLSSVPLYAGAGQLSSTHYATMLADPAFREAALNSLVLALYAAIPSVLVGIGLAVLVARTDIAFRRTLGGLLLIPLLFPGLGMVLGWISMYSPAGFVTISVREVLGVVPWNIYSLPGMAVVITSKTIPVVYLFAQGSLAGMDSSLENAARTTGATPLRSLTSITLPMLRPAALSGGIIVTALTIEALGIPLLLGTASRIDTLSTYLYRAWNAGDVQVVSAGGVVLLALIGFLLLMRHFVGGDEARFVSMTGKPRARQLLQLGRLRWLASAIVAVYVVLAVIAPVLGLILTAFTKILTPLASPWDLRTWGHFEQVFRNQVLFRSVTNSLMISIVGGIVGTVLVAAGTIVAHRSRWRLRGMMPSLLLFPRAIPGIVMGLGFFWVFIWIEPLRGFRTSVWAVMIAFMVRQFALSYGAVYPSLAAIGPELDAAARTSGATWEQAGRRILMPLLKPALLSSFLLMFVSMLNDYDPAVFLVSAGSEVMGLTMLQLWIQGFAGPVAALGVIQLLLSGLALLGGWFATRGRLAHA